MFKKTENSALPIGVLLVALLKAPFGETIIAVNKNKPRITKEAVKYLFNCSYSRPNKNLRPLAMSISLISLGLLGLRVRSYVLVHVR